MYRFIVSVGVSVLLGMCLYGIGVPERIVPVIVCITSYSLSQAMWKE